MKDGLASLYIHIPFCASFCDYCDFYSVKIKNVNDGCIDAFLSALVYDIKYQIDFFSVKEIASVYIGGGTPSVLGSKIAVLLDALNKINGFSSNNEFTIEANPESLSEEFLSVCREGGVNRLSLGVQTFHEKNRKAVNRGADAGILKKKLTLASRLFPDMLSMDLVSGLPYQTEEILIKDINCVLEFKPSHVSLYSLTIEDGTPLKEKIKTKTIILPKSEYADSLWLTGREELLKAGFEHYEVSNFSLPGRMCLHNVRYWQMQSWLGAGPAACGTIVDERKGCAKRYTYAQNVSAYIKGMKKDKNLSSVHAAPCEELDRATLLKESILMGYRCKDGPVPDLFKQRFGSNVDQYIGKTLEKWKGEDRMLFLNSFLCDAFLELESTTPP